MLEELDAGWDPHLGLGPPPGAGSASGQESCAPTTGAQLFNSLNNDYKGSYFLKRNVFCIHVGFPFTKAVCCRHFNGMTVDFCGVCSSVVVSSKLFSAEQLIACGLFPVAVRLAQGDPLQKRQ